MTIPTAPIKGFALAATIACTAALASGAAAADLEVRIDGLRSADGHVRVALHRQVSEESFPGDDGVVAASFRRAAEGAVRVIFADVTPGAYAVAAFHDADADGALNQRRRRHARPKATASPTARAASWARPASRTPQ